MTSQSSTLLNKVLEKSKEINIEDSEDSSFKVWKSLAERTLIKVFGDNSYELNEFRKLSFSYQPIVFFMEKNYDKEHLIAFRKDLDFARSLIKDYIDETEITNDNSESMETFSRIFISHSSKDKEVVGNLLEILEMIGLDHNKIFCSSFEGYGVQLGQDFLQRLKNELDSKVFVLFVLSKNFYNSPVCLCEMGATWIKTNEHIPILIPPFGFKDIKGVIPSTQGFLINNGLGLNSLKERLEALFLLTPIDSNVWERKRDKVLVEINRSIAPKI